MRAIIDRKRVLLVVSLLLVSVVISVLVGCNPKFKYLRITQLSTPPTPHYIMSDYMSLTAGSGVMIKVEPESKNSVEYDNDVHIELGAQDASIARVYPGINNREFAVVGLSPGDTVLRVVIEGSHKGDIAMNVIP